MTLYEKEAKCGGHTLTDDSPGYPVDLGFQVLFSAKNLFSLRSSAVLLTVAALSSSPPSLEHEMVLTAGEGAPHLRPVCPVSTRCLCAGVQPDNIPQPCRHAGVPGRGHAAERHVLRTQCGRRRAGVGQQCAVRAAVQHALAVLPAHGLGRAALWPRGTQGMCYAELVSWMYGMSRKRVVSALSRCPYSCPRRLHTF